MPLLTADNPDSRPHPHSPGTSKPSEPGSQVRDDALHLLHVLKLDGDSTQPTTPQGDRVGPHHMHSPSVDALRSGGAVARGLSAEMADVWTGVGADGWGGGAAGARGGKGAAGGLEPWNLSSLGAGASAQDEAPLALVGRLQDTYQPFQLMLSRKYASYAR